jgi:hypothetical protein
MTKTKILTTHKTKATKKGSNKKWHKRVTKKLHKKHSGYSMKGIVKGQMTYKKGRKK